MRIAVNLHPLLSKGGAEKVLLAIAAVLGREHEVDVMTCGGIDRKAAESFFGLDLSRIRIRDLTQDGPLWQRLAAKLLARRREGNRYKKLLTSWVVSSWSEHYDLFINGESGLLARNRAQHGILYVFFPWNEAEIRTCRSVWHYLYSLPYLIWLRLHPRFSLDSYDLLLTTSHYVNGHINNRWHRTATLLRPPADGLPGTPHRRLAILTVGRIFRGTGHDKRLDLLLNIFKQCWHRQKGDCEFHIAGFINDPAYARELEQAGQGYPIHFHFNVDRQEIWKLNAECMIYWHGAGYGQDLATSPEKAEHFGMTTVEAMVGGCVPVVFKGGGQPEIVRHGQNGFTWTSPDELMEHTLVLLNNTPLWESYSRVAQTDSQAYSMESFARQLQSLVTRLA
jgi:glycosyltransferase involved in cell wall biosynthesis